MKKTAILLTSLGFALGSLQAQTVPQFINYQGRVTEATGLPLGATGTVAAPVAAPVNRKIIFRLYDAATGGTRLWTEEQTVTISLGEFSVLLGQGINATGTAAGESRPLLEGVFTSSGVGRFLEVTVDNGDGAINASDTPITPRQQITTSAYSFHARSADTIAAGTDLQLNSSANYGLGYYGTGRLFNGTAIDGPVLYGNAGGALGSNISGTQNTALRWNAAGQVGIGSTTLAGATATNKLVLQGDDATTTPQQLLIRGATDTNRQLLLGFQTTGNYGSIQALGAAATATSLTLNPFGGNVGIGTATPAAKLDVAGTINASGAITALSVTGNGAGLTGLTAAQIPVLDTSKITTGTIDARLSSNVSLLNTAQTTTAFKSSTGHLGMGTYVDATSGSSGMLTYNNRLADTFAGYGGTIANYGLTLSPTGHSVLSSSVGVHLFCESAERLTIGLGGKNGINNPNPTCPLDVFGSIAHSWPNGNYFDVGGGTRAFIVQTNSPVTIKASSSVEAAAYFAVSDARIKNILGRTDGAADLATLSSIEITNFEYKDKLANSGLTQKKVIAQQLETVFPQAVSLGTNVVPDIYKKAIVKDGWVALATDLKVGERVRLMVKTEHGVHEVTEVKPGAFRTAFRPATEEMFVYGREVKDFRTVDYEAISMLNVSATQELKKQTDAELKTLHEQNTALETKLAAQQKLLTAQDDRIAALEAKDKTRETRLGALEQLLTAGQVRTVSLKADK